MSQVKPDKALKDVLVLGGDPEKEALEQEAAEKEAERLLSDAGTSEKDREIRELQAKLVARERELDTLKRRWVDGDWSDLDPFHLFEIVVQATPFPGGMLPAKVWVNGDLTEFEREVPKVVPKYVLEVLDRCKYNQWEKIVDPSAPTGLRAVHVQYHRYPFSARPIYTQGD